MVRGGNIRQEPAVQGRISGKISIGGREARGDQTLEGGVLGQLHGQPHRMAHALDVKGMGQQAVIQRRLPVRVGGRQANLPSTQRLFQDDRETNAQRVGILVGITAWIGEPEGVSCMSLRMLEPGTVYRRPICSRGPCASSINCSSM